MRASRNSLGNAKPIVEPSRGEREIDDPADAELHLAAHEPLVGPRKRAREGTDVVGGDHRSADQDRGGGQL